MEILAAAGLGMLAITLLKTKKPKVQETTTLEPPNTSEPIEEEVISVNKIKTPKEILRGKEDNKDVVNGIKLRMEPFCRDVIENFFNKQFNKVSSAVKNPKTNRYLELDGFNQELRLAFEYQGIQHYHYPNHFHRTENEYKEQIWRDYVKREGCKAAGIELIIIPYTIEYESYKLAETVHLGRKRNKEEIKEALERHLRGLVREKNIKMR